MAAIDTYLGTVHKEFRLNATWPPGSLVELGDVGVMSDGAFVRMSNIKNRFHFKPETREAPAMRFATRGGVEFKGSAHGETGTAVSAIAKLDAGLSIRFKREGALVFVMDPAIDEYIDDVGALAEWMDSERGNALKPNQVVITHIRRALAGIIAMASEAGAEVQLKTDAKIAKGKVDIADVRGKLELVTSRATAFVAVPRGRSGTTPLYRCLHYDDQDFWSLIRGQRGRWTMSQRMAPQVGMFPAPRVVRGYAALRPR